MTDESVEVVVVGGGQAGLAMSEHLSAHNLEHVVLERDRVASRWRSERWDSLVANGPAWHDRFPTLAFADVGPDEFATKDQVADYFLAYSDLIDAPIRCGVEVSAVRRHARRAGFCVETTDGTLDAQYVVAATGPFQQPVIPPVIPAEAGLAQRHSSTYRNPGELPEGAVLVVGAGSSGVQIADELLRAGRRVFLSVGPHERPPRRYRGRDFVWWLGVLGKWDAEAPREGAEHVTIAVSGALGGHTVDLRDLAARGMALVGSTSGYDNGRIRFAADVAQNIARGDASLLSLLDEADAYVARSRSELPEEPEARELGATPAGVEHPATELDVAKEELGCVVWATGFAVDYRWLQVDAFTSDGRPNHRRGVSSEPGVLFLGLPWLSRRGSSFIWGVWHDARFLADHIATQRRYMNYRPAGSSAVAPAGWAAGARTRD